MASGHEQQEIGEGNAIGQAGGERVAFEMVDGQKRLVGCCGQRLGGHQADDEAAHEAGAGGGGDGVDVCERQAGFVEGRGDDVVEGFHMGAGGDLRNDSAEDCVVGDLAENDIGQDGAAAVFLAQHDRCGGFVAACLDTQNTNRAHNTNGIMDAAGDADCHGLGSIIAAGGVPR